MTATIHPFPPRPHTAESKADDTAAIAARFAPPPRKMVSPYLHKPLRDEATARAQLHPLFAKILSPFRP